MNDTSRTHRDTNDDLLYGFDTRPYRFVRSTGLEHGTFPYRRRHRWPWIIAALCVLLIAAGFA